MAYKQPKNTPMHNDGASEPITAAVLGALKVGKLIAGAVKGAKAAKAASAAAKLVKAGKVTAQGVQTTVKGSKLATKVAKLNKAGKTAKAAKKGIKAAEETKKAANIMKEGKRAQEAINKGKEAQRAFKTSKQIGKEAKRATDYAKGKIHLKDKLFDAKMQIQNKFNQGADKVSKITGKDFQTVKDAGIGKIQEGVDRAGTAGIDAIKESSQPANVDNLMQDTEETLPNSSSYTNPMGPSNNGKGVKPSGNNPGIKNASSTNTFSSLDKSNIKPNKTSWIDTYSAPISIGGIQVDAGSLLRAGRLGTVMAKDKIARSKMMKEIKQRNINLKQSKANADKAAFMKKMAQDIKLENLKG
jgi:hypothetical protein